MAALSVEDKLNSYIISNFRRLKGAYGIQNHLYINACSRWLSTFAEKNHTKTAKRVISFHQKRIKKIISKRKRND